MHNSVAQAEHYIRQCEEDWFGGEMYSWAIVPKVSGQCEGMITIKASAPRAELGYVLSREYWNKGLMTEAVNEVCEFALKQKDIYRVWATCHIANAGSRRVLEKADMTLEGILRSWAIFPGLASKPQDCCVYARITG